MATSGGGGGGGGGEEVGGRRLGKWWLRRREKVGFDTRIDLPCHIGVADTPNGKENNGKLCNFESKKTDSI